LSLSPAPWAKSRASDRSRTLVGRQVRNRFASCTLRVRHGILGMDRSRAGLDRLAESAAAPYARGPPSQLAASCAFAAAVRREQHGGMAARPANVPKCPTNCSSRRLLHELFMPTSTIFDHRRALRRSQHLGT